VGSGPEKGKGGTILLTSKNRAIREGKAVLKKRKSEESRLKSRDKKKKGKNKKMATSEERIFPDQPPDEEEHLWIFTKYVLGSE